LARAALQVPPAQRAVPGREVPLLPPCLIPGLPTHPKQSAPAASTRPRGRRHAVNLSERRKPYSRVSSRAILNRLLAFT
jgi:hypothetical protein